MRVALLFGLCTDDSHNDLGTGGRRGRRAGEELYVRAVVTPSLLPENPSLPDQRAQGWTQPVGWEEQVTPSGPAPAERHGR